MTQRMTTIRSASADGSSWWGWSLYGRKTRDEMIESALEHYRAEKKRVERALADLESGNTTVYTHLGIHVCHDLELVK